MASIHSIETGLKKLGEGKRMGLIEEYVINGTVSGHPDVWIIEKIMQQQTTPFKGYEERLAEKKALELKQRGSL